MLTPYGLRVIGAALVVFGLAGCSGAPEAPVDAATDQADEPWRLKPGERVRCDEADVEHEIARQIGGAAVEGGVMSTPDEMRAAGRSAAAIAEVERQWRSLAPDVRLARLCLAVESGIDRS